MRTPYEKPPPCGASCPRHQSRCTFDKDHGRSHQHFASSPVSKPKTYLSIVDCAVLSKTLGTTSQLLHDTGRRTSLSRLRKLNWKCSCSPENVHDPRFPTPHESPGDHLAPYPQRVAMLPTES